ncbi:hypothetical protein Bca52824_024244 [Brassica carinata]|uniref:F-box associated beta-propeller type 3 domain-containing protein n=1 Tax=Brassica carinata TaxID=52824 RepID=A0A8X8AWJ1_BRACI|nr:hypothetical protein Bca52824_024244 [Brassica carinata]
MTGDCDSSEAYQVLTLGARKLAWRKIKCSIISHAYLQIDGICLNGVIYYVTVVNGPPRVFSILCFDVRSEKFKVINRAEEMAIWCGSTLVNYKGTLGALLSDRCTEVTRETKFADAKLFFVGVTGTDEIVLSPHRLSISKPCCFYFFYYNIESNTIRRVEIRGLDAFKYCRIHMSLNHVEDVKLLQYI